jgi:hypothetical protein
MVLQFGNFVTILSFLGVVYNVLCAYFLYHLTDHTNPLPINVTLYSIFATANNVLGVYGSIAEHTFALAIFANFLILDTLVSAVPRAVTLYVLASLNDYFCADGAISRYVSLSDHVSIASRMRYDASFQIPRDSSARCASIFRLAIAAMAVGLVSTTLMQMVFAVFVRRFSTHLALRKSKMEAPYAQIDNEERASEKH